MSITGVAGGEPEALRAALVADLESTGVLRDPRVTAAFRTVPREAFLPEVSTVEAYTRRQVVTKRAVDGAALSSASSPSIVAIMLEQLAAAPGHRVLEVGAATGINAALLANIVGETGAVTTIEFDADLAARADVSLRQAGYGHVVVVHGDGAFGAAGRQPFDRIIVTAGAGDIAPAWWDQLADDGRLVVPLRLHDSGLTRSVAFDRVADGELVAQWAAPCGFVPMRGGIASEPRKVGLIDGVHVGVPHHVAVPDQQFRDVFAVPAHQLWSGVVVGWDSATQYLDLWLATHCGTAGLVYGKLSVDAAARESGVANPAKRWSGAACLTADGASFAYLTSRAVDDDHAELGVVIHGDLQIAAQLETLLHQWNATRPTAPTITATRHDGHTAPATARSGSTRPHSTLTITW